jgi:beta-barrel assembly-enhancing protease
VELSPAEIGVPIVMAGLFYRLGKALGPALRQGKWVFDSVTGSEADAVRAEGPAGRDLARALLRQMPADPDPEVGRYLGQMGACLAGRVRARGRRFQFFAVAVGGRNAFALPGGYVFVTRPLLESCRWDNDEVAFVLGHEMGHVLRGHAMERVVNGWALFAARRALPVGGIAAGWLLSQAAELVHQAYSREQELDADSVGVQLARSAGFDPRGAVRLLSRLRAEIAAGDALDDYFAAHPPLEVRIGQISRSLRAANS